MKFIEKIVPALTRQEIRQCRGIVDSIQAARVQLEWAMESFYQPKDIRRDIIKKEHDLFKAMLPEVTRVLYTPWKDCCVSVAHMFCTDLYEHTRMLGYFAYGVMRSRNTMDLSRNGGYEEIEQLQTLICAIQFYTAQTEKLHKILTVEC